MSRRIRQTWWASILVVLLGLQGGCSTYGKLDELLLKRKPTSQRVVSLKQEYVIHFPDKIDIVVGGPQPWSGQRTVRVDGRVFLPTIGLVFVGGRTPTQVAKDLADQFGVLPRQVSVKVLEHQSQQLFLYGEVAGLQRVVAYRGPETVLEVLQRTGGITAGAAPSDAQVVRAHVAEGKAPEIYQVDLEAILREKNDESNILVQPFDQIYIGETRQWSVRRALPPFMRPLYDDLWGLRRGKNEPVSEPDSNEPK